MGVVEDSRLKKKMLRQIFESLDLGSDSPDELTWCVKDPNTISQVPLSLLTSAGSPLTLKLVYFSGTYRLSCSQGSAQAWVCPPPQADSELWLHVGSGAILRAFPLPRVFHSHQKMKMGIVCFCFFFGLGALQK